MVLSIFSLFMSFVVFGLIGAGIYELIIRRRHKKYRFALKKLEEGEIAELPNGYKKEPVRLKGFLYVIVVLGIGWLLLMGVGLLAFGACLVIFTSGQF